MPKPRVETPEEKQYREHVEQIANNIQSLAQAVRGALKGPLKRKSLILLLAHSSKQPQSTVDAVLQAIEEMDSDHLK